MRLVFVCLVPLVLGSGAIADAKVATPTLDQLVRSADAIAVVQVERLHRVGSLQVADATVVRAYRGVTDGQRILYLADRTWPCDISRARAGETSLLFLEVLPARLRKVQPGSHDAELDRLLIERFGVDTPRFRLAAAGRGRLEVTSGRVHRGTVRWRYGASVPLARLEPRLGAPR